MCLLGASSGLLCWNALRWYDFFDMSGFMDAGYRVLCGQRPFVDFFYITGPVHLYLHALFFWIFGFSECAILVHLCVGNALALLLTYLIARRHLPLWKATLATSVTAICFYGPISHPWYDQNALLWVVLGVFLLEREAPLRTAGSAVRLGLACGALSALSFMTKSNVGGAGALVFLAAFLSGGFRARALGAATLAGLAVSAAVLLSMGAAREYVVQ